MKKKGVANVIAYIMLVGLAVAVSGIVFVGLRDSVPDFDVVSCPDATEIYFRNVQCSQKNVCVDLINKGKFTADGYVLRGDNRSPHSYDLYVLNDSGSKLVPGWETSHIFSDASKIPYTRDSEFGNLNSLTYLEVQPYIYDEDGKKLLCKEIISVNFECVQNERDCTEYCSLGCTDNDVCTSDSCVGGDCQNIPNDPLCEDDNNACTNDNQCDPILGCQYPPIVCPDSPDTCQVAGECDPNSGCTLVDICTEGQGCYDSKCIKKVDLIFLLDISSSIYNGDGGLYTTAKFEDLIESVRNIIGALEPIEDFTNIGIITYNSSSYLRTGLTDDSLYLDSVINSITPMTRVEYENDLERTTFLQSALLRAYREFDTSENNRDDAENYIVVVGDAVANRHFKESSSFYSTSSLISNLPNSLNYNSVSGGFSRFESADLDSELATEIKTNEEVKIISIFVGEDGFLTPPENAMRQIKSGNPSDEDFYYRVDDYSDLVSYFVTIVPDIRPE